AAEDAVVDLIIRDCACLNRRMRPDCARNPVFDLRSGNADDRSGVFPASCQRRTRHIVSPAPPALGGMACTHPMSAIIIELAGQKRMVIRPGWRLSVFNVDLRAKTSFPFLCRPPRIAAPRLNAAC